MKLYDLKVIDHLFQEKMLDKINGLHNKDKNSNSLNYDIITLEKYYG